eukprot:TRINITY_DN2037_c0_g1_i2.p1 TRINITY_DN2037_c0_g1~~TRINITY_DN2037_c0_g1_i2.p1  ORF type:complete len:1571 (-),score=283.93 TRINITY_DN2037_c0_g1_i2:330-5042(-)
MEESYSQGNKRRKGNSSEKASVTKAAPKKRTSPETHPQKTKKRATISAKQAIVSKEKEPEEDSMSASDSSSAETPSTPPPPPSQTTTSPPPPAAEQSKSGTQDALQNLLRRSGLEEFVPASSQNRSRVTAMIDGIKAEGDLGRQMDSLIELCDYLSMGTEDTLTGFRADAVVPSLVNLLNYEDNPEIMLYAARALTYMMEALPASCMTVVNNGAVPIFCEKLLVISFMDVAEQSLQALDKVSAEHPIAVLRAGGLMATLSFLDFFSIGVKRSAINTAANVCRGVPNDSISLVSEVIPLLTNLLSDPDQKAVESTCLCFARLADSFQDNESNLQILASQGLVSNVLRLIASNPPVISSATYLLLLRLLSTLAHGSAALSLSMLQEGVSTVLQSILSGDGSFSSRSSEQTTEVLALINELLPPLPNDMIPVPILAALSAKPMSRLSLLRKKRQGETTERSDLQIEAETRIKAFSENPHIIVSLAEGLFDLVIRVYGSTVNPAVRNKCILIIIKTLHFCSSEVLKELLRNIRISSFIATQLAARDQNIVLCALKMASILIKKLPEIFDKYFKREGVLYEIETLARKELPTLSKAPETDEATSSSSSEKGRNIPTSPSSTPPRSSSVRSPSALINFLTSSSPPSSPIPVAPAIKEDDLKTLIVSEAKQFKATFFGEDLKNIDQDFERLISTKELLKLREISSRLLHCLNEETPDSHDNELKILLELQDLLTKEESVSTFEFLQSKAASSLVKYLTWAPTSYGEEALLSRRRRWKTFCVAFSTSSAQSKPPSMLALVRKLQDALNATERFQVLVNEFGGPGAGLSFLTQPFKLKLQKDPSEKSDIKDYSTNIVLIEPLASIKAIEDFLWSRVKPTVSTPASPQSVKRAPGAVQSPGTASLSDSSSKLRSSQSATSQEDKNVVAPTTPIEGDNEEYYDDYDDYDAEDDLAAEAENSSGAPSGVLDVKLTESGNRLAQSGSALRDSSTNRSGSTSSLGRPASPSASNPSSTAQPPAKPHNLVFLLDGQQLPYSTTIFQTVQRLINAESNVEQQPTQRMWEGIYTIRYKLATEETKDEKEKEKEDYGHVDAAIRSPWLTPLDSSVAKLPPRPLGTGDDTYETLLLLYILEQLNRQHSYLDDNLFTSISQSEFLNEKITSKILRQLQDPLTLCSGSLPDWCRLVAHHYSFLLPVETRRLFFNSTSFGIVRALHALQQRMETALGDEGLRIGRITRQKVRVSRSRMLESAIKVMDLFGKQRGILEVEYFGEVGTGLGPTLEFYTCVSEELQNKKLKLWLDENTNTKVEEDAPQIVHAPGGLFPAPIKPSERKTDAAKKIYDMFQFMGCFVAKALLDSRILDMPFSNAFYKWILGQELSWKDLKEISPFIGSTLDKFITLIIKKKELEKASQSGEQKLRDLEAQIFGGTIEDLCLDFTMPGHSDWELKPDGTKITVTIDNVEEYVNLIVEEYLIKGVEGSLRHFAKGFNSVFSMDSLKAFSVAELDSLVCGEQGKWDLAVLMDNVKCDHGYSMSSRAVEHFLEIVSDFDLEQQRKFLLFLTGSPKLPVGGTCATYVPSLLI